MSADAHTGLWRPCPRCKGTGRLPRKPVAVQALYAGPREHAQDKDLPPCPTCNAGRGEPCVWVDKPERLSWPHRERSKLAKRAKYATGN